MNKTRLNDFIDKLKRDEKVLDTASKIAEAAPELIEEIDRQFQEATKLDQKDIIFLFSAIALQCARQYIIGALSQRMDDQMAAKQVKGKHKEHSDRHHRYYNPSLDEVLRNPVPFDANVGSNGALSGGGRLGHRVKTAGHDPLLGLIFGTANIATSTLTTVPNFQSYHIITGQVNGARDVFGNHANTMLVLKYTKDKILSKDFEQMKIVAAALVKEVIHLRSDVHTKNSLPLPVIGTFSPQLASNLADVGLDVANLQKWGRQAGYSVLINVIIGMLHGLFYREGEIDRDSFMVKTKKILNYSNIIASSSNVIAVAIGSVAGTVSSNPKLVKKSLDYLDVGGIAVTILQLIHDRQKVYEIKREFMRNEWYKKVKGALN